MGKFFRKTFEVELEEALVYPSAKVIRDTLLKEVKGVEFVQEEEVISFKTENVVYEVQVKMARGGYTLICKEAV